MPDNRKGKWDYNRWTVLPAEPSVESALSSRFSRHLGTTSKLSFKFFKAITPRLISIFPTRKVRSPSWSATCPSIQIPEIGNKNCARRNPAPFSECSPSLRTVDRTTETGGQPLFVMRFATISVSVKHRCCCDRVAGSMCRSNRFQRG